MTRIFLASISALVATVIGLPAQADVTISNITDIETIRRSRDTYVIDDVRYHHDAPSGYYITPDDVIHELGGSSHRYHRQPTYRRIIIQRRITRPTVIQQPIIIQQPVPVYPQPFLQHSFIPQPVIQIPAQTEPPRLLHGKQIQPLTATVFGEGGIPGREGPGAVYPSLTTFVAGQAVVVTQIAGGGDGYDWFLAASGSGQRAWVRGDRLVIYQNQ